MKSRLRKAKTYKSDDTIRTSELVEILKNQRVPIKIDNLISSKHQHRVSVSHVLKRVSELNVMRPHYDYDPSLDEPEQDVYPPYSRSPYPQPHPHLYDGESTDSADYKPIRPSVKDPRDKPGSRPMDSGMVFNLHPGPRSKNIETSSHKSLGQGKHGTYSEGAPSRHDENSDDDFDRGYFPPPLTSQIMPNSRRQCRNCRKSHQQIKEMEVEIRDLRSSVDYYRYKDQEKGAKIQEMKREHDKLRLRKAVESETPDHMVPDFKYEQMKKHLEDKINSLERALQKQNRDYHFLHEEWYQQRLKIREQETVLYQKDMEIEKFQVELLKTCEVRTTKRYSENRNTSAKPRQNRPNQGETLGVNRGSGGIPMTRTQSDQVPVEGGEEGVVDQMDVGEQRRRARSQRSLVSEEDDGSQSALTSSSKSSFRVLNEDVSRSVFSDSLPEQTRMSLVRSLGSCHSQEDVIRNLFSYGCVPLSNERYLELEMRYHYLEETHGHLQVQNDALKKTFDELKQYAEQLYAQSNQRMSNENALKLALKYCHKVVDMLEVVLEMRMSPADKSHTSLPPPLHGLPYESAVPPALYLASKVRRHLNELDTDREFQNFVSNPESEEFISSLSSSWSHELSQNTTSGFSSVTCSSIDGELSSDEIERFKQYIKQLFAYQNRMQGSLVTVDGLKGLETVRQYMPETDCQPSSGSQFTDLEDAAHLEELYAIREEKAELRSRIYMMEQGKKQADLEISRKEIELREQVRVAEQLEQQLSELRLVHRKSMKDDMEYSQLKDSLRREDTLQMQYDDLYRFLKEHIRKSKENHEKCMEFISDLHRANHALVDAYEKSMKQQRQERKQMREELQTHMMRSAEVKPGETHL